VGFGYLAAAGLSVLVLLGSFGKPSALGLEHAVVATAFAVVLGARIAGRMRRSAKLEGQGVIDVEVGALLLVCMHAALQLVGGTGSEPYPLLYVLAGLVGAVSERRSAQVLLVLAIGFEALVQRFPEGHLRYEQLAVHAGLLAAFGMLHRVFTFVAIGRAQAQGRAELDRERQRAEEDARLFRLVATPSESAGGDEERMVRSSVAEVQRALFFHLDLVKRTMGLYSCVLLMADESGEHLRLVEAATESDDLAEGPFGRGAGAVGAAFQRGVIMNLQHLKPGYGGIGYYRGPSTVRAFIAVPVREGATVRGVLCADRVVDRPFDAADEEALQVVITHLLRAVENERVFMQLERSKQEHAVLRRASQALGAAQSEQAVLDAGLSAASEIAPYDFAAVTQYDADAHTHSVRRAVGEGAANVLNLSFGDNTSLTAMAVKNRHYLPYRGEYDPGSQVVYTRKASLLGMQSLLILPLVVRDVAIGTLALAAKRRDAFGATVRPTLAALSSQLAVALSNAASVQRLEELATTDGLTGCYNKRYFSEQLKAKLGAAERFGRKLSLLITDIDHFKMVNDTYGHATGDVVIKEVGAILNRLKRETDVVARFGGEEFCVLCEETDTAGAVQLAERVRQELERTTFETELGKLTVTCSLGVATFPHHAKGRQDLFEAADRALYKAKQSGRNRVQSA
jgi:two-component system cell cycle response regulator